MTKEKSASDIRKMIESSLSQGIADGTFSCAGVGFSNGTDRIIMDTGTAIPHSSKKTSFCTLYDVASIQKPLVAAVALKMIDIKVLGLTDKVGWRLEATGKGWDTVRLHHLLTNSMKLGITERLSDMEPEKMRSVILSADVVRLGDGFHYHNSTSMALGWFLEKVLAAPIARILQTWILKPAGMKNTFWHSEIPANRMDDVVPSENCPNRGLLKGVPQDEIAWMHAKSGRNVACSGIFSTASDLVRFGEYLIKGAFEQPEAMHGMMLRNYLKPFDATFGLGFDVPRTAYLGDRYAENTLYHTGFSGGAIHIQPFWGNVMVSLTNATYAQVNRGPDSPINQWRQRLSHKVFG